MGTRADFYAGKGENMVYMGSIAYDGMPDSIDHEFLNAKTFYNYILLLDEFLSKRSDATFAKDGWPWPWDDSNTTDYAYTMDKGQVWVTSFGDRWIPVKYLLDEPAEFPDMSDKKNLAPIGSEQSGIILITG